MKFILFPVPAVVPPFLIEIASVIEPALVLANVIVLAVPPVNVVNVAAPIVGVVKVGEVANTARPDPVSLLKEVSN